MNKYFFIFILVLFSTALRAGLPQYGNITIEELENEYCAIDSSAGAYYIYNYGYTYLEENLDGLFRFSERSARIKILDSDANNAADLEFFMETGPYGAQLISFEMTTYNLEVDGSISKTILTKDDVLAKGFSNSINLVKVPAPNVKTGSVVEYKYLLRYTNPIYEDWIIQQEYPVLKSFQKIETTFLYGYTFLKEGKYAFASDTSYVVDNKIRIGSNRYPAVVTIWEINNIPAFATEPYCLNPLKYRWRLRFQITRQFEYGTFYRDFLTSWEDLRNTLASTEFFGGFAVGNRKLFKSIAAKFDTISDLKERVQAIVSFIKINYSYNGIPTLFSTKDGRQVVESNTGNAAELNLLLYNVLKESDIETYLVVLRRRELGKIYYEFPFRDQLTNVVVLANVNNERDLLDVTNDFLPWNMIPANYLNGYGLVVDKADSANFVPLVPGQQSREITQSQISFNESKNMFTGSMRYKSNGYEAARLLQVLKSLGDGNLNSEIQEMLHETFIDSLVVNSATADNGIDIDLDIKVNADQTGNRVLLWPVLVNPILVNPFTSKKRFLPIEFDHAFNQAHALTINIPDNYEIESVPDDVTYTSPDGLIMGSMVVKVEDKTITVITSIKIKENGYDASKYNYFKELYGSLYKAHTSRISLIFNPQLTPTE